MGFFEPSVMGDGGMSLPPLHRHFVVIAPMTMKFGTVIKLDVFYIMVTKKFLTSRGSITSNLYDVPSATADFRYY